MEHVPYWDENAASAHATHVPVDSSNGGSIEASLLDDLPTREDIECLAADIQEIKDGIGGLSDLFTRRLLEDRQKNELIRILDERSSFAVIEPFISDLVLLIDRAERVDGDFAASVVEELLEILRRRDIHRIHVGREFDPNLHKIVKVVDRADLGRNAIIGIVRNGYTFGEKVLRPAEVVLGRVLDEVLVEHEPLDADTEAK